MIYRIKIQGALDQTWSNWLGNVDIRVEQTEEEGVITMLTVDLTDQAALFGILDHVRDLNLGLVSVNQQGEKQEEGMFNTRKSGRPGELD